MKSFNESFYTTDFDKEMIDFITSVYEVSDLQWDSNGDELVYGTGNGYFWTNTFPNHRPARTILYWGSEPLTKQQFKEKIGMPQDNIVEESTFGKKDLVDGMFVKTRSGEIHVVIGGCAHDNTGWMDLEEEFYENLLENSDNTDLDIVEVFIKERSFSLTKHFAGDGLTSIWKRTPPKSIKVINLEKLITMHEEQLEATKKLLAEELNNV